MRNTVAVSCFKMDDVVSIPNVENICRLCLSPDDPKSSIFDGDDSSVPLSCKIQACLAIQISSTDKLSTLICRRCITNVNQWHSYRESCLKAQDKLQQWQMQQMPIHTGLTIKQEPIDLDFETDQIETITDPLDMTHDEQNENDGVWALHITNEQSVQSEKEMEKQTKSEVACRRRTRSFGMPISPPTMPQESERNTTVSKPYCTIEVKDEPLQEDEYDSNIEIESVTGGEILPNPVAAICPTEDRVMEADSTQRSNSVTFKTKKKVKRGPHTHLRNKHQFRKKCVFCQINLHSKYSYGKHMERFHTPLPESEQIDNKANLKLAIKQKAQSTKSQSAAFQDEHRFFTNNLQEENSADELTSCNKDGDEEMIEDVEDEINKMDRNSETPLSQVQQNIIGQLKTYSCYSCKQVFPDRRTTLNHLRQHLPDLRPFTCVACLTQFSDRLIYKNHCYTSFECAMKIAIVEPKSGLEKYFTCNMCSKSVANRQELLNHLTSQHSDDQLANETPSSSNQTPAKMLRKDPTSTPAPLNWSHLHLPGPYVNGNPAFNLPCSLCGMIYKHKRNLLDHQTICSQRPASERTSYACVHCRMTFLLFRKYTSHLYSVHSTSEITCSLCRKKFNTPTDFLVHHKKNHPLEGGQVDGERASVNQENSLKEWNDYEEELHTNESRSSRQKYSCALCGQEFPTRTELGEHRNLHLKVKIYSCVICRSMFSSAGALEVHMKDHGIEDPAEQSAHTSYVEYEGAEDTKDIALLDNSRDSNSESGETCNICNKSFTSSANRKRHIANVHKNSKNRRKCTECRRVFTKKNAFEYHVRTEHKHPSTSSITCPMCPQTFTTRRNLNLHYETTHINQVDALHECDICGKQFKEDLSLKIHRGWHTRKTHRLISDVKGLNKSLPILQSQDIFNDSTVSVPKPARARKSFPNSPPSKPKPQLQCQVCDDKFIDVGDLRKHLWDVHCSRNKNEKNYTTSDLQCELCTHTLPDKPSLERHLEWHVENPILSDSKNGVKRKRYYTPRDLRTYPCEICGNFYTSRRSLLRHQKLHKVSTTAATRFQATVKKPLANQFPCNVCNKIFDTSIKLRKHRLYHLVNSAENKRDSIVEKPEFQCNLCSKYHTSKIDLQLHSAKNCPYRSQETSGPRIKRRKIISTVESNAPVHFEQPKPVPVSSKSNFNLSVGWRMKKMWNCSLCLKSFLGRSTLYKHQMSVHGKDAFRRAALLAKKKSVSKPLPSLESSRFPCTVCTKDFPTALSLKLHMSSLHKDSKPKSCNICGKTFSSNVGIRNHMQTHSTSTYSCNLCQRLFRTRQAVYMHVRRQHPDEYLIMEDEKSQLCSEIISKPEIPIPKTNVQTCFRCEYCDKSFDTNKGLRVHVKKSHSMHN
ncbi:zinc finger protein Xfin-like [Athalia rosae]|uniref:zinc finger protein Xfin-like n=1 Tax=Athalia rosae TaxID=37344 RepID=UPI0020344E2B|nr:zinc finger protein Xfin-like [Athalia rosae]